MAWLVGHGVWRGRNIGRSGTKRHVGNPVVVSKKCEYLGIACYPLPESICYGRGTKHSCGQSHPVSSCQPAPVISHSGTEMLPLNGVAMGPRLHGSSTVWAPLLPSPLARTIQPGSRDTSVLEPAYEALGQSTVHLSGVLCDS